jgi:hypothetical protein
MRRTLSFAAIPTILEDIWLPGNAFKGLTAEQMSSYQGPTYAMFELDYGVRMVRADENSRRSAGCRASPAAEHSAPRRCSAWSELLTPTTMFPWSYGAACTAPTPIITAMH